jgi:hypothetical protein
MRERHASNGRSNRFPRLTGKLSRLSETCARGQEAVNLLQNTPRAHSPALVNYVIQTWQKRESLKTNLGCLLIQNGRK